MRRGFKSARQRVEASAPGLPREEAIIRWALAEQLSADEIASVDPTDGFTDPELALVWCYLQGLLEPAGRQLRSDTIRLRAMRAFDDWKAERCTLDEAVAVLSGFPVTPLQLLGELLTRTNPERAPRLLHRLRGILNAFGYLDAQVGVGTWNLPALLGPHPLRNR